MGLLVGDAVGVPYEFHNPSELPPFAQLDMCPPPAFERAHAHVPKVRGQTMVRGH